MESNENLSQRPKRQKSLILINPKFQWILISYAALIAALVLAAVYGLFTFGFHEFVQPEPKQVLLKIMFAFQFIQMQETTFLRVIGAIAVVTVILLTVGGLVISPQIADPFIGCKEFGYLMQERTRWIARNLIS